MKKPLLSVADMQREATAFPTLDSEEMAAAGECGKMEICEEGRSLFEAGQAPLDSFVVVSGALDVVDTSGDEERLLVTYGPGAIIGDINGFAGRPAVAACRAAQRTEVIRLTIAQTRTLLVREACLGEKWIAAFLRRRELLEASGFEGLRVYGTHADPAALRLREFLYRNGVPHHWMDITEAGNKAAVAALGKEPLRWPAVVWGRDILLQNPTIPEIAARLGLQRRIPDEMFDTVIIGSGPAGLGAAVYAASEGLRTVVLDLIGPGGQAGSSSRIENYPGFPAGLSGRELGLRMYVQALKFGATFSSPVQVTELRCRKDGFHEVVAEDGAIVRAKTIIIATGVAYRSLSVKGLRELHGAGVFYSATQVEATLCQHRPVHVIGAGNSAGQAAMYLSHFTDHVFLVVRGGDLNKSMSSYLAERVRANPRIHILLHCELCAIEGTASLEKVHLAHTANGKISVEESGGIFIFIGATPCTGFVGESIRKDDKGFILTGAEAGASKAWSLTDRSPRALETCCPGVFAAGDCRSRTTKRVAFAVGDGAFAVTCVHDFLGTYA
ncbi:MAG TPA: FAD-dependent oxidoreductase [Candidatus Saccharimonadales bacterium]|nr:FAD-dependent oxidoreductase [Candidatus Saccharimonadales bacterium]